MPDATRQIPATGDALEKTLRLRPILWVGAGASVAAGHPSTGALVNLLKLHGSRDDWQRVVLAGESYAPSDPNTRS